MIYDTDEIEAIIKSVSCNINGRWVPCRPIGYFTIWGRVKATWLVLTGKADALVWLEGQ